MDLNELTDSQFYYNKYKINGLCTKCGKPALDGRTLCAECAEKHKVCSKEYYHKNAQKIGLKASEKRAAAVKEARKQRKCVVCLKAKADKGYSTCWRCRADRNDWARGRYDNETEEHREQRLKKGNERNRARKARLIEQGLCISCGKRKADKGRQMCSYCAERKNAARRDKARQKGIIPQEMRGKGDYCKMCCKPVNNGARYCPECAEKMVQSAKRLNEYNKQQEHNTGYIYFQRLNNAHFEERRK